MYAKPRRAGPYADIRFVGLSTLDNTHLFIIAKNKQKSSQPEENRE